MPASKTSPSASPAELQARAGQAADFLRGLANPERLVLLCQLLEGERSVGELETATGIRQPTLSQQLGVLRRQSLVTTRREGTRIYYGLGDPAAATVLEALYAIYCKPAKRAAKGSR